MDIPNAPLHVIIGTGPVGRAWHIPSPPAGTTRAIVALIAQESGRRAHLQTLPSLLLQTLGLFNPTMREVAEMRYEFEEAFILDASRFEQTFGMQATHCVRQSRPRSSGFVIGERCRPESRKRGQKGMVSPFHQSKGEQP